MTDSWDSNPYYNPEACGLETVASFDFSDGCYQFDLVTVWKDDKGQMYWAMDSGCSCPSPYEDYHSLESLERLDNFDYFEETVNGKATGGYYSSDPSDFLREVKSSMGR